MIDFIRELLGLPPRHRHIFGVIWCDSADPYVQYQRCSGCKLKRYTTCPMLKDTPRMCADWGRQ